MSEPIKLDPIFGTVFGDHAEDCRCDDCERPRRENAAKVAELEAWRAQHDAEMRADGMERCESCAGWFESRELNPDGECSDCERKLEDCEP